MVCVCVCVCVCGVCVCVCVYVLVLVTIHHTPAKEMGIHLHSECIKLSNLSYQYSYPPRTRVQDTRIA
jgi:hypothetical protein